MATKKKASVKKKAPTKKAAVKKKSTSTAKKLTVKKVDMSKVLGVAMKLLIPFILGVLVFVSVDLLVQYLNNDYSIAVVNGVRVPKKQYYDRLESAFGEQASAALIEESLIEQAAKEEGVEATEEQIAEKLKEIEESIGGSEALASTLETNNITMEELERQLELDILARAVVEPTIEYTDEDLEAFFELYKDYLFEDEENPSLEDNKEAVEEAYLAQEYESEKGVWVAELQTEAKIQNNYSDEPSYGFLTVTRNILSNLWEEITN